VLVMVEYDIDPERTDEFFGIMRESRRIWLAHGLHSWSLFSDLAKEGRHVEQFVDESWASYLRRNERISASYLPLRERKRAMHIGPDAPAITRYIARDVGIAARTAARTRAHKEMPGMAEKIPPEIVNVAGHDVTVTSPHKVMFPEPGYTKLDLVRYYIAVADGALRGSGGRPNVLARFVDGIGAEFFYQKRAPASRPDWIEVVTISFPSGRTADEIVPRDAATLAWMANLACLELHPHPVRAEDLDHPDELRIDLDPVPGVEWSQVRDVAAVVRETLADLGLTGWPKTSGKRGIHVNVRIRREWNYLQVRRAALAFAREVERRVPALATSKWWKEERHGVFLDYNQNAKDRTRCRRVLGAADAGCACVGAAPLGRSCRGRAGRLHAEVHAEALRRSRRPARGHRRCAMLARKAARAVGEGRARRTGRCAVAAAVQEAGRRTAASAAVETKDEVSGGFDRGPVPGFRKNVVCPRF
jgi:DNA ligase D-like protein (predicted polymerase)